jgi:hypothetical protein
LAIKLLIGFLAFPHSELVAARRKPTGKATAKMAQHGRGRKCSRFASIIHYLLSLILLQPRRNNFGPPNREIDWPGDAVVSMLARHLID